MTAQQVLIHARLMEELLQCVARCRCPSINIFVSLFVDTGVAVLRRAHGGSYWGRWLKKLDIYESIENKNGMTQLQRELPDPMIMTAKLRAREMIFMCHKLGLRLKPTLPLEVWKQIFSYVNRAEHVF